MSFSLFSNGDKINYGIKNYIADDNEDLKNIPRSTPGSMIYVIKTNKYYILNNQFQWVEQNNSNSDEDGSSIDEDQVNALINAKIAQIPTLPDPTGSNNQVLMTQGGAWTISNIPEGQTIIIDETLSSLNNGHAISNKAVTTAINTINNAGYQTAADVQSIVTQELSDITSFEYYLCEIGEYSLETGIPIAEDLDEAPDSQHIYLTPGDNDNLNMYAYIDETFVFLGTTEVDLENYIQREDLADVAFSGSYNDLDNKPDIPTDTADLTNGAGYITDPIAAIWWKATTGMTVTENESGCIGNNTDNVFWVHTEDVTAEDLETIKSIAQAYTGKYINSTAPGEISEVIWDEDAAMIGVNITETISQTPLGYDRVSADAPVYIIQIEKDDESETGYSMNLFSTTDITGTWKVLEKGSYLTEHQSLAEYTKTNGFNSVAFSGNYNDLSNLPINSSGSTTKSLTLSKPLTVTGGDSSSAGKIILDDTQSGQITNNDTNTLFGFMTNYSANADNKELTIGHGSYYLRLRGKTENDTRPTYNGNNLAFASDIPTKLPVSGNYNGSSSYYTINVTTNTTPPSTNDQHLITIIIPSS